MTAYIPRQSDIQTLTINSLKHYFRPWPGYYCCNDPPAISVLEVADASNISSASPSSHLPSQSRLDLLQMVTVVLLGFLGLRNYYGRIGDG